MSRSSSTGARLAPTAMVAFLFLLVGAGLAFVGVRIGGPFVGGAVAAFGVAATLAGAHSMITRGHRTGSELSTLIRDHSGVAAVLFGLSFLVPGLVMVVVGLASVFGMADGLWAWATARPGPVVMGLGVWVGLGGLGMLISRWKYAAASTAWWQRVPGQMVGLVVIAMGVGLIAVGRLLALDPAHPREVLGRVAEWIARLLAGGG